MAWGITHAPMGTSSTSHWLQFPSSPRQQETRKFWKLHRKTKTRCLRWVQTQRSLVSVDGKYIFVLCIISLVIGSRGRGESKHFSQNVEWNQKEAGLLTFLLRGSCLPLTFVFLHCDANLNEIVFREVKPCLLRPLDI